MAGQDGGGHGPEGVPATTEREEEEVRPAIRDMRERQMADRRKRYGRHDLSDRRWLSPEHAANLDAGTLDLPGRINDHNCVLVSVPYRAAGTPVAWVDKGLAEIVYLCALIGADVDESCDDGWGAPTLWFIKERGKRRFLRIAGIQEPAVDGGSPERTRYLNRIRRFRMDGHSVLIHPADLERVRASLREYR